MANLAYLETDAAQIERMQQQSKPLSDSAEITNLRHATLPTVLDVPQAARLLGIGRTLAYELVRTDQWPTPVIRVGRLIKIPSAPLIEFLSTGCYPNGAEG